MDPRYWKEFEKLDDMSGGDKRSGSEDMSPRYPNEKRRKPSRSRSSSSSSSGSSSRSSSSSSRRHSDSRRSESRRPYDRDVYRRISPNRGGNRGSGFGGREDGNWFPQPPHQGYPPQSQDLPPSSSYNMPGQYPQGPPPGQYPPNFQGQNFGNSYHSYGGYEPPPPNFYPPNYPPHSGSQPPPHLRSQNFPMGRGPHGGPGPGPPPRNWDMFPDTMLPPPIIQQGVSADGLSGPDKKAEEAAKKEAIEQELIQQKRTLSKQREDYVRRKFSLNRELSRLKDQKRELLKEKSKENERIIRDNAKLQGEIQQKLKSIDNVIEMLTNIIGDGTRLPEIIKEIKQMEKEKTDEKHKRSDKKKHSPEKGEGRRGGEPAEKEEGDRDSQGAKNFIYYDPGLHWCADCNVFPKTVSDYLEHLHGQQHRVNAKMKLEDYPWHNQQSLEEKSPPVNKDLPSKRIPIRGVQFLIPATAWFCSMCKAWLGDSHCAMKHVQSNQHSQVYNEFISKNPHWEVDWLTERTRSYERKSEANRDPHSLSALAPLPSSLDSLSNQLLAMIANTKESVRGVTEPTPPPPPPPPIHKSSSSYSSDDDSLDMKSSKKKKKSKKKKNKERSPSKEKVTPQPSDQIKLSYKSMIDRKVDSIPVDDSFISEWMPRLDKREVVPLKKKPKEENENKPFRKGRQASGSREPSSDADKKPSPYGHTYHELNEELGIFDKRGPFPDRDVRKRKHEDDPKYDRHLKYGRVSPKEKHKYKGPEKFKNEKEERFDDYRPKKDLKHPREISERDRIKKSPFSRMKDSIEKKKTKNKLEKTSDEDGHETAFEKRSSESAAKKKDGKKLVLNALPKTKLPFIGRMPILKKKVDQKSDDKEGEKKDNEEEGRDASEVQMPFVSQVESGTPASEPVIDELPKSTLIISKRPRLAEPGIVKKEILFDKPVNDNLTEQDMELDDESGMVKEEEPPKDELHKDFKEALDLLFPEEKKKEDDVPEAKEEIEPKLDEQQLTAALPPPGYMLPTGYDVSMYPQYYDQQAYVHQQWAQMGYEHAAQYPPGPYAYPPPAIEQTVVETAPQPVPEPEKPAEPKKKKNPPSQRMRRHLMKKKALEAAKESAEGTAEDDEGAEGDGTGDEDVVENGSEDKLETPEVEPPKSSAEISDLAMLGIDEDDAAAMGFY